MVKFYKVRPGRPPAITRRLPHHLAITATETSASPHPLELTASEPLAVPAPPRRWKPWAWFVAIALHLVLIALLLVFSRPRRQQEALQPSGVSVVYEPGATSQQSPRQAAETAPAQTPPPPAPPPPQVTQTEPEVNLNLPDDMLAPIPQSLPQPAPPAPPQPRVAQRQPRPRPRPRQKYLVMNNMSLGSGTSTSTPNFGHQGMNLSLPQSDAQAVTAPEVTIQGDMGADWGAAFNKWVYAHLYYPNAAAEQGQQGYVTVTFTAHRDGSITGLHLDSGSGSNFLDLAWQGIFAQNQLPPFPPGGKDSVKITATVHYELEP